MKNNQVKFIIVDDHPIIREGLGQLITQEESFTLIAEAGDAQEAINQLEKTNPDFAIIDISLKGIDGIELIKIIKTNYPHILILVVSMHDESLYAIRALKAGANGYIMKQEASKKVMTAIQQILAGKMYLSNEMQEKMLQLMIRGDKNQSESFLEKLSDRELQIFQLIGKGLGVSEIASHLNISKKTVETYRQKIKEKLLLKSAVELRQLAINWHQNQSNN